MEDYPLGSTTLGYWLEQFEKRTKRESLGLNYKSLGQTYVLREKIIRNE